MNDDRRPGGDGNKWVDSERQPSSAFDSDRGVAGLGYSAEREAVEGAKHPAGEVNGIGSDHAANAVPGTDIPTENGRRASFDPRTGEVHGSGAGAGGGNPGEDFDSDSASGDGYPLTGSEGRGNDAPDRGPSHFNE
jgi:hypothetical protein